MPFLRSDYRTASLGALVGSPSRRVVCARVLACVKEEKRKKETSITWALRFGLASFRLRKSSCGG